MSRLHKQQFCYKVLPLSIHKERLALSYHPAPYYLNSMTLFIISSYQFRIRTWDLSVRLYLNFKHGNCTTRPPGPVAFKPLCLTKNCPIMRTNKQFLWWFNSASSLSFPISQSSKRQAWTFNQAKDKFGPQRKTACRRVWVWKYVFMR